MSDPNRPDEGLQKLLNDVENVTRTPAPSARGSRSARKGRKPDYRDGLQEGQTDRRKTAKATGKDSIIAGQYLRRSFTFRPDQLNLIEQLASELGLSQNDLLRWFVDMGIEAVEQGELPPITEEVRHRYDPGG